MNRGSCFAADSSILASMSQTRERSAWTLLSTHGRVLVQIARDPAARIRDIAAAVDLTERATQAILADLEDEGFVSHTRVGRRNRYQVNADQPLRYRAHADYRVGSLLALLAPPTSDTALTARAS